MFYGMSCGRRKRNVRRLLHILLRACECARVWFVRKIHTEAGKQEIFHKRERQKKGKKCRYGWKKHGKRHPQNAKDSGWKIGMTEKKHGRSLHKTGRKKTLRKPPNTGIVEEFPSKESSRTENPFRKMWIFLPESSEKSGKIMDTERKISHTVRKKLENDSKGEEKMPGNGKRKPKKQAFPSKRIQEKHWKNGNGMKKFLSTGQKNIPMKRKNLENGWSG